MVALQGGDSRSNGQNFKSLLQDSPYLANYIRCIKLVEWRWGGEDQWLPEDTTLLATLPLLGNLSSLYVRSHRHSWQSISTSLVKCLSDVLRLPSLQHVVLKNVPLRLLNNVGPSLRHISIEDISTPEFHPSTFFSPDPLKEPLLVESLQILDIYNRDVEFLNNWLQHADNNLCFKQLKRLYIVEGNVPGFYLARLLDTCQSSLEELVYEPCVHTYNLQNPRPDYLDISKLAPLRTLNFGFEVNINTSAAFDPFPWLLKHLNSLPSSNVIEELIIQINIDEIVAGSLQAWQGVSAAILKKLKCLRSIEIHFCCFDLEYHDAYTGEILQNTKDLQSTNFFLLRRADDDLHDEFRFFPPYSTWHF